MKIIDELKDKRKVIGENEEIEVKENGITLIALVITIIVLLILVGVTIATLTGENGILTRANDAKVITEISALEEDIDVYVVGEELNNVEGIERYPIIKEETMESINKDLLSIELKQKMSKWANTAQNGEIATIDTIDYSKFYKIDKEKVETAKAFEGDLYLIEVEGEYKVISINEVVYQKEEINIIIPLDDIAEPEYITVGNNTYKWYGNGDLAVIGELNSNSGITSEENTSINGLQEFKLKEIAKGTDMAFDSNVETEQNIAKVNGVKKIYFHSGTAYIIDANDDLWAWGANDYNKLGQGNSYLVTEPTKILEGRTEGANGVKTKNVWAGPTNTFVLDKNNRLWACGANADGVLGQGNNDTYYNFVEVKIDGLDLNNTEIELYPVSTNTQQYSSVILKCSAGRVYGCGVNTSGNFGIGTSINYNRFIELSAYNEIWKKAEKIYNHGIISFIITKDGTLYEAGYNGLGTLGIGNTNNINILTKLDSDIIDVRPYSDGNTFFKKKDGYLYTNDKNGNLNRINGLQDIDAQFLGNNIVVSNNKMYRISISSISSYHNEYNINEIFDMNSMNGFISNNKIYLDNYPNITKPKEKSIYRLRNVFTGAQFVQSGGNNINIVDNEGNIYEGINNKNTDVNNIKQILSSNLAQFALSGDGKLYAKGNAYMWGDISSTSKYTIVTKDGNEEFNNINKIFAIKNSYGCIFTTTNNEMYWSGGTAYVGIPNIRGDYIGLSAEVTKYPKKVENEVINSIIDKIKDIKFNYLNEAGIGGKNTLILTNDGKLYTYSNNSNMTGVGATSDFTEIKFDGATVEQIETLDGLSLAVLSNGEVYGWGYNTYGILGEGYELGGVYPTPVKLNLSNVRTMSLGDGFAIFGTYAGEVYGIGKNDYGQLGTGDNTGASTFVRCEELEK